MKMRHYCCHASRVTVSVTPPYPAEAKCDGAPKGQRVHSPGQGERSETTPWVGKPPAWRPIRGKSNTLWRSPLPSIGLLPSLGLLPFTGRNSTSPLPQGVAPKVACRWAMHFIPFREYSLRSNPTSSIIQIMPLCSFV